MEDHRQTICVGSRKSELALIQTKHVIASLQKLYPDRKFEIHTMTTMGDRVLNISLPKIGEKALFTKDLEDALHNGKVDFVVHSLKDLPTCLPDGMAIGAVLEREDPRDALVLNKKYDGQTLESLAEGSILGTSSLRRGAQLARKYSHLKVEDIRGNLNTRLAKLDAPNSKFAGIVLAYAGLVRMGWQDRISQVLDGSKFLYAVGQGALAVECRSNDTYILDMLQNLTCIETECKILAERSFLKTLGGGCSAPVAVVTDLKRNTNDNRSNYELNIIGSVWSLDGASEVLAQKHCNILLEDANSNDVPLAKRKKFTKSADVVDNATKIVDDSATPSCSTLPPVKYNVDSLLNIHGDLFAKCPYTSEIVDPSSLLPVGQDVMGECPYFDVTQKTLAPELIKKTISVEAHKKETNDDKATPVATCPFLKEKMEKTHATSTTLKEKHLGENDDANPPPPSSVEVQKDTKLSACPFIKDSNDNKSKRKIDDDQPLLDCVKDNQLEEIPLYCGLYRHKCYQLELFEKCEELGQQLAKHLIANGALEVMESAQFQIRKNL